MNERKRERERRKRDWGTARERERGGGREKGGERGRPGIWLIRAQGRRRDYSARACASAPANRPAVDGQSGGGEREIDRESGRDLVVLELHVGEAARVEVLPGEGGEGKAGGGVRNEGGGSRRGVIFARIKSVYSSVYLSVYL